MIKSWHLLFVLALLVPSFLLFALIVLIAGMDPVVLIVGLVVSLILFPIGLYAAAFGERRALRKRQRDTP